MAVEHFEVSVGNVDEIMVSWDFPGREIVLRRRSSLAPDADVHFYAGHDYYKDNEQMLRL